MIINIDDKKHRQLVRELLGRADVIVVAEVLDLRQVEQLRIIISEEIMCEAVFADRPPPPGFVPFSRYKRVRPKFKFRRDLRMDKRRVVKFKGKKGRR